jgi:hypothetical protein
MAPLPEPRHPTVDAIYAAYEAKQFLYNSPRMGAAEIGHECARYLYYSFHWADVPQRKEGRILRLFGTGHMQEARLAADLRLAGAEVIDKNPDTGKQWEMTDETGHIVCRMDAAICGLPDAPKTWHVGEFKTHNDKSFKAVAKDGVEKAKPEHYAQCQIGMHFSGMDRAYYMAHNKNDDALYDERLCYDITYSTRIVARAHRVIFADNAPQRISDNATWFACKLCKHHHVCHDGALPPRNCRTCIHVRIGKEQALWSCSLYARQLDRDAQRDGCGMHRYTPDMVAGKQVDATGEAARLTITYEMHSGAMWRDGEAS